MIHDKEALEIAVVEVKASADSTTELTSSPFTPPALPRPVTIQTVTKAVAKLAGVTVADLQSADRSRRFARPRQLAVYLARQWSGKSYPILGRHFNRDHSTIIHAVEITQKRLDDPQYQDIRDAVFLIHAIVRTVAEQPIEPMKIVAYDRAS